jgi:hypothetical protein
MQRADPDRLPVRLAPVRPDCGSRTADRNLKIGTVLVRDYHGRRHTVTVAPEGYVWEGNPYSSLSAVARAITGTAWSARVFASRSIATAPWDNQVTAAATDNALAWVTTALPWAS